MPFCLKLQLATDLNYLVKFLLNNSLHSIANNKKNFYNNNRKVILSISLEILFLCKII